MACATGKDKCNQDDCGVCYPLTYAIVNDVVYYIYHDSDRATLDYIVMGCELTFSDPDTIVEAKKELLVKVQDELIKINKTTVTNSKDWWNFKTSCFPVNHKEIKPS